MHETFKQFNFEAAHQMPPHSGLHGHSFTVEVVLRGEPDPVFGWTHNLYDVEHAIEGVRGQLDHRYLNEILPVPSLENVAAFIWNNLDNRLSGLSRLTVRRGIDGQQEGCVVHRD